jgi:hypothetical protein
VAVPSDTRPRFVDGILHTVAAILAAE